MSEPTQTAEIGRDSLAELFAGSSNFVERLPMLRVALERAADLCTENLAAVGDQPPVVALAGVESGTAADLLGPYSGKGMVAVLHAAQWNARLVAVADQGLVFSIVETMLGSDGTQPAYQADRPFTRVEKSVAGVFFRRLAASLERAFADVAETPIAVESIEDEIEYDVLGSPSNSVVAATFGVEAMGGGGQMRVAVTRAALNPLRQALARVPAKEAPAADARWSQQIQNEVSRAYVMLTAVLDERMGMLGEVADFRVGQIVEFNATAHGRVRLECNGERLMWCHLGKSQGKYTLRVDEMVDREQEFMDEILAR
jgi:flagellar motor switch protein FliM